MYNFTIICITNIFNDYFSIIFLEIFGKRKFQIFSSRFILFYLKCKAKPRFYIEYIDICFLKQSRTKDALR